MGRTSASAARFVFWASALAVAVFFTSSVASTVFRVLQEREPRFDWETLMRLQNVEHVAIGLANLAATALFTVGLFRLAGSMTDGVARRLLFVTAGAAAVSILGFACLSIDTVRVLLLREHVLFTSRVFPVGSILLSAVAPGAWLLASARLLRSFDLRLPRAPSIALAFCLVPSTTLDASFSLVSSPGPFLQSSIAEWASVELSLLVVTLEALVAWRVWQALQRFELSGGHGHVGPYRGPEQGDAAATERARRAAFDSARGVRQHSAAALAYAAIAVTGVVLSAYAAGWHKFYADCAVRQGVASLSIVALLAMVLTATTSGSEEAGARRWALALAGMSLAAWGISLANLDGLTHYMNGNYGDGFYARLDQRDALFTRMVSTQTFAQILAIAALAVQAAAFARASTALQDDALARRAMRLALLVALIALAPVASYLLANSESVDLALFGESTAKSPVVQGTLVIAVLSAANFYRLVSRRLAAAFDARAHVLHPIG